VFNHFNFRLIVTVLIRFRVSTERTQELSYDPEEQTSVSLKMERFHPARSGRASSGRQLSLAAPGHLHKALESSTERGLFPFLAAEAVP